MAVNTLFVNTITQMKGRWHYINMSIMVAEAAQSSHSVANLAKSFFMIDCPKNPPLP